MEHSSDQDIEYRLLCENDFESVWNILHKDFSNNEPVAVHIKLSADCPMLLKLRSEQIKRGLKQNASFGAFEKASGELIGCSITHLSREAKIDTSEDENILEDAPLNFKQLLALLTLCSDGISSLMGVDDYMEITYMSCREDYCGRGIGTKLFKMSFDIASQKECKKVLVVAFNHYVQRMAEKLGFHNQKEIEYSKYIDPLTKTKVFAGVPEPHVKAATMIKSL